MWYVFGTFALIAVLPVGGTVKKRLHALSLLLPTFLCIYIFTENIENPCSNPDCLKDRYPLLAYLLFGSFGVLLTSPLVVLSWAVFTDNNEGPPK